MNKSIYAIFLLASFSFCSEAKETPVENNKSVIEKSPQAVEPKQEVKLPEQAETIITPEEVVIEEPKPEQLQEVIVAKKTVVVEEPVVQSSIVVDKEIKEVVELVLAKVDHSAYSSLLTKYVTTAGDVNYKGFKTDHGELKKYIDLLKENAPQTSWSRNEKLSYWINLYNALTINLILDNYPIESITKIDKAWDTQIVTIAGKGYTLNDIENKVIRPTFKEPRIHFAVNCAAKSCPKLLNEAFVPEKLEAQLEKQTKAFVNNATYNKVAANKVQVSKIFEWYAVDFGNLITYLNKYSIIKISSSAAIEYIAYDWQLNEK